MKQHVWVQLRMWGGARLSTWLGQQGSTYHFHLHLDERKTEKQRDACCHKHCMLLHY